MVTTSLVLQWGQMPLLWAAYQGHLEVAELLVENGADLMATDKVSGDWRGTAVSLMSVVPLCGDRVERSPTGGKGEARSRK